MNNGELLAYYDDEPEKEWRRTSRSVYGGIEYKIVQHQLSLLIPNGSRVLDMGTGAGIHALGLAKRRCIVGLVDISPRLLDFARQKLKAEGLEDSIAETFCGSAGDYRNSTKLPYDAALLFGPLYHLTTHEDRARCLKVALQSVKPGGLIFSIFISKYAILKDLIKTGRFSTITGLIETGHLTHGNYRPSDISPEDADLAYMPETHAASVSEAVSLYDEVGLDTVKVLSCESFLSFMGPYVNPIADNVQTQEALYKLAVSTCEDPSLAPNSDHFMVVGKARTAHQMERP